MLRPLADRILVQRLDAEKVTKSGLIIPDQAQEKPQQGKVIAVGKGRILESGNRLPMSLEAGDTILFGKYTGSEVTLNDETYIIMDECDVWGVLEGE